MDASERRGLTSCAAAALLFGAATPLASRLAAHSGAPALAGLLYVGAALGVAPRVRAGCTAQSVRREARRLGTSVVFGGFAAPLFLVAGLARSDAATASLLLNLELVATVLLAGVLFREHIGRRVAGGVSVVLLASVILVWSATPEFRVGALLVAAACACWAVDNCVTANIVDVAPEIVTFAKGAIAGSTNLVIALATHASFPTPNGVVGALAIGMVGYGLSITLWIRGAREIGAARGQLVFAAAPFAGAAVAWVVLRAPAPPSHLLAMVLAAGGVAAVVNSGHEHAHTHPNVQHDHEHTHDDGHHVHDHASLEGPHSHLHEHGRITHAHAHVPDIHHRHDHSDPEAVGQV